jgi:putative aminopeptidase FrvX
MEYRNYELLKSILSVPTKTYQEDLMIEFLDKFLTEQNIPHYIDDYGNVYATKTSERFSDQVFPCVILVNSKGMPTGIGGDDKCGIFGALTILMDLPHVKAAFFVSEETGCHGSKNSDPEFFKNVGYTIQLDAPENYMISEVCSGVRLFKRDSDFFRCVDPIICEMMIDPEYMYHPYTDVSQMVLKHGLTSINISCGYYNYHTANEYIVLDDLYNSIEVVKRMIESLGYETHLMEPNGIRW